MPISEDGANSTNRQNVDDAYFAARVSSFPPGRTYYNSARTGTIAAGLAADSTIYSRRLDPSAGLRSYLTRFRIDLACVLAFTTAADLEFRLRRGGTATPSGGNQITVARQARSDSASSECNSANGGDIRIATTGALTMTSVTFDAENVANIGIGIFNTPRITLTAQPIGLIYSYERFWDDLSGPCLLPGELFALTSVAAAGATGTWTATIQDDWIESAEII